MKIRFDNGEEYWVDGETIPANLTVEQLKQKLIPWRLHEAYERLNELRGQLDAIVAVSDNELLEWAKTAHPTVATINLLNAQFAEQQHLISQYTGGNV